MSRPPSYLQLLRTNVDFRRLWFGVVVSFFGDWFSTIAVYAMAEELAGTAGAIAAVMIGKTLPMFLVTPLAGPLIDRFDRRALLIGTDLARALLVGGLVAGYLAGNFVVVVAVLWLKTAFSGVFVPTRTSVIPQLTTPAELPVAMALSAGTWSVMLALGAAAGGLVTAGVGIVGALVVDAATFVLSAAFLWRLPALPPQEDPKEAERVTFTAGVRYLGSRPVLRNLLLCKAGVSLGAAALVTLPLFGSGVFPGASGPAFIGLMFASRGAGALVGSLGVRRIVGDATPTLARWMVPAFGWTGGWFVLAGLAPAFGLAALAYFASAIGNAVIWVFSSILMQRLVPQGLRGRLFSIEFGLMTLVTATSSWVAGAGIDHLGWSVHLTTMLAGSVQIVPLIAWGLTVRSAAGRRVLREAGPDRPLASAG